MTTPQIERRVEAAGKAATVQSLLDHIGWAEAIKPALEREAESYAKMVVQHVLGQPLPEGMTQEKLAGLAYGLTEAVHIIEAILKDGEKALSQLRSAGINAEII